MVYTTRHEQENLRYIHYHRGLIQMENHSKKIHDFFMEKVETDKTLSEENRKAWAGFFDYLYRRNKLEKFLKIVENKDKENFGEMFNRFRDEILFEIAIEREYPDYPTEYIESKRDYILKKGQPSIKTLAWLYFTNPITRELIVSEETLRRWVRQVERMVEKNRYGVLAKTSL